MILAGVYKKLLDASFDFNLLENPINLKCLSTELTRILNESHLEDPEYKASSTNPIEVNKVVDEFDLNFRLGRD